MIKKPKQLAGYRNTEEADMKLSKHQEELIKKLAKKQRLSPEEYLLKALLAEYKRVFRKDYLL